MRFGLDFGTSNSALAVEEHGRVRVLPLDPIAGDVLPTVLYVRRDRSTHVGQAAVHAYLADNRERDPIRREFTPLGIRVESSVPGIPPVEAHILTDQAAPGRFFQALKTFCGDPLVIETNVFGDARGFEELIAIIFVVVRARAAALTGNAPEVITLGRPVRFIGDVAAQDRAVGRLRAAAALAGFREVSFVEEPVAAARAAGVGAGLTLVFDFGGGTLDLCIVRRSGATRAAVEILGTAGADIGGDRITELLIAETVAPALGAGAVWGPKRLTFPRYITNAISDWHALSALNERTILDRLDDLVRLGAPPREVSALRSAIELQLGYDIFALLDDAKRRLSSVPATLVTYHRAAVDVDARVTRSRFEAILGATLARIDRLLDECLAAAGISALEVDEVVTTGGSSAIPAVRALLLRRFPQARSRDADPFSTVAAGLALS